MSSGIAFLVTVNLTLGIAAGIVMHRADFCVAGMFRDLFMFRSTRMLRSLVLLVIVSMILFEGARRSGLLAVYPFPLLSPPSLVNIGGGMVFGIGMVLAGGCVVGTLYKMGSGSAVSATAFAGLIIGSGLYAEIHSWWTPLARKFAFAGANITLPQAMGTDPLVVMLPIILLGVVLSARWTRGGRLHLASQAAGYLQPWKAAIFLALFGTLSFILVGMPFGITTAYAKLAAYIEMPFLHEHVAALSFYQAEPLDYTTPVNRVSLQGGAGPFMDGIAYIQLPLIAGIVAGACVSALLINEFKVYYRIPGRQYVSALAGGILLALGSRMTPGCNVWHLFGGLPILALQSIFFLAGILPGAYIGTFLLTRTVLSSR